MLVKLNYYIIVSKISLYNCRDNYRNQNNILHDKNKHQIKILKISKNDQIYVLEIIWYTIQQNCKKINKYIIKGHDTMKSTLKI